MRLDVERRTTPRSEQAMSGNRDEKRIPRRELLQGTLTFGLAAIGASALAVACGKSTPKNVSCEDTTGLKPDEIEQRKTLAYTDKSPEPEKNCANCNQYIAPP